jgi:thiamine-phosphate pyrophosphorylase
MKPSIDYGIYLVTDRQYLGGRDFYDCVEAALSGGVTLVQLREKNIDLSTFFKIGEKVKILCDSYKVPLLVNDNITVAKEICAAGVHLGQEDDNIEQARKQLGEDAIIGISAHTVDEALEAEKRGADYLGVGAVYPTGSKLDAKAVGLERLRAIKEAVHIPIVGIGGISVDKYSQVMSYGIAGCAMISGILADSNIAEVVRKIRNK